MAKPSALAFPDATLAFPSKRTKPFLVKPSESVLDFETALIAFPFVPFCGVSVNPAPSRPVRESLTLCAFQKRNWKASTLSCAF